MSTLASQRGSFMVKVQVFAPNINQCSTGILNYSFSFLDFIIGCRLVVSAFSLPGTLFVATPRVVSYLEALCSLRWLRFPFSVSIPTSLSSSPLTRSLNEMSWPCLQEGFGVTSQWKTDQSSLNHVFLNQRPSKQQLGSSNTRSVSSDSSTLRLTIHIYGIDTLYSLLLTPSFGSLTPRECVHCQLGRLCFFSGLHYLLGKWPLKEVVLFHLIATPPGKTP